MSRNIKFIAQRDNMDCGPACLAMVSLYYKKIFHRIFKKFIIYYKGGCIFLGLKEAAKNIGLDSFSAKLSLAELIDKETHYPCVLHWNQKHFIVLYRIKRNVKSTIFILRTLSLAL